MNRLALVFLALLVSASTHAVEPQSPTPAAASDSALAARTVYLVRHGHYAADASIDEKVGPGLSPTGVAQAKLAGARIGALPFSLDGFYVSPMQRARDTAAVISGDRQDTRFSVVDDLAECTPPTRDAAIMAREKPADLAACKGQLDRAFARFFQPARGSERSDLLVCHGNVIRSMVVRALGVDGDAWLAMSVSHASITKIRVQPDGSFKVIAVGDVGHMPPNLLTGASGDPERSLAIPALPLASGK
ncbi:MAG: histidine phosphatase family protein [Pseudomonadota bacterium]